MTDGASGDESSMPFEKFERRRYLRYDRDLAFARFHGHLRRQLKQADREEVRRICADCLARYFGDVGESTAEDAEVGEGNS